MRNQSNTLSILLLLGFGLPLAASSSSPTETNTQAVVESTEARDARMDWWRDARFGMFVHWGLYSGLAGTWKGEMVGERGNMEWIQYRVKADTWEYTHEAVPHFHPDPGFAETWAELAREAGCQYMVFTTKHHDGFSLHDSSITNFDAMDLVGRDLCREITDALRAEGLKVGYYHSLIDWHHPQYDYDTSLPHPLKDRPSPNGPRDHDIYVEYLHHQVDELLSNYGPVDILWWDYSAEDAQGEFWRADELTALVRKHQPQIITNNRLYSKPPLRNPDEDLQSWDPEKGDFTTPEQNIPDTGLEGVDWEVCMTMNTTWGYSEHDHAWKSDETLLRNLIDIVSKGGNYLLNIGPRADGSIPEESIQSMQTIGQWMSVNGESIYGTQASPFARPDWGRYTRKPGKLYAHVFSWPDDGILTLAAEEHRFKRAYLLADPEKNLEFETDGGLTRIHLPDQAPDPIASVVALEYE